MQKKTLILLAFSLAQAAALYPAFAASRHEDDVIAILEEARQNRDRALSQQDERLVPLFTGMLEGDFKYHAALIAAHCRKEEPSFPLSVSDVLRLEPRTLCQEYDKWRWRNPNYRGSWFSPFLGR